MPNVNLVQFPIDDQSLDWLIDMTQKEVFQPISQFLLDISYTINFKLILVIYVKPVTYIT